MTSPIVVEPATARRWEDIVTVFGRRGNDPSWCWCRRFLDSANTGTTPPDNRSALCHEIAAAAIPPGLIAYREGQPVGWSRLGPRSSFPRVTGNRALARILVDDPSAWWVTCFAVHNRQRRTGIGAALLAAGIAFACGQGATALEGHPVDVDALSADRVGGSALYTGTMAMFTAAGFSEVARTYPSRPLMRLALGGSRSTR